jgi:hypothetical protein
MEDTGRRQKSAEPPHRTPERPGPEDAEEERVAGGGEADLRARSPQEWCPPPRNIPPREFSIGICSSVSLGPREQLAPGVGTARRGVADEGGGGIEPHGAALPEGAGPGLEPRDAEPGLAHNKRSDSVPRSNFLRRRGAHW